MFRSADKPPASAPQNPPASSPPGESKHTYGQILKSSAIVGGSSVVGIVVSIVRSKVMALLLGPAGVGLVGLFSSVLELTRSIAELGINRSGVRQIAEAVGSGDQERIARTATVLRRTSMLLGAIGAAVLILFRTRISVWTFGNENYSGAVALLSVAVFLTLISDGQAALIQGMRRISDLARIGIVTAVLGAGITLGLVFFFRERGVVASLIGVAALTVFVSWFYRRKIHVATAAVSLPQLREELKGLLLLGFAFMASAVLTTGAAYAIRIIVRDSVGLEAAGLYQSAWALGGMYVGFILQAMASDFYPRLTAIAGDHKECNRLVNEQAHISLLLAGPGIIGTVIAAPLVIGLFYAPTFAGAVEPLRWICLGMLLRVVAWPMGFIVLAKGAQAVFFWTEVAATVVHVGLAFVLVRWFGLAGATMAFFGLYIWHGLLTYAIVHRLTGFVWSSDNRRTIALFLPTIGVVFTSCLLLPFWVATAVGTVAAIWTGVHSAREICRLVSPDRIPPAVREWLARLRILPAARPAEALSN